MSRWARFGRENWLTFLVLAVLVLAFMALRTRPTEVASSEALLGSLAGSQPTLVEFYSNA